VVAGLHIGADGPSRLADEADAVYPPEQGNELPIFDAGSYLGGDRGIG
jgi:hypothetical protein